MRNNIYEDGIPWTPGQSIAVSFWTILQLISTALGILTFIWVLFIWEKVEHTQPCVPVPMPIVTRDEIPTIDEHVQPSELEGLLDAVAESRKKYSQTTRELQDSAYPPASRLNSACIKTWGIDTCASAMWQMCNDGTICADQTCKQNCKVIQGEISKMPASLPASQPQSVANIESRNRAIAASRQCIMDKADPACGVAVRWVCDQNNIKSICTTLVEILKFNFVHGRIVQ